MRYTLPDHESFVSQVPTRKKGVAFVGLSGGVDSSVAAALLKRDGYTVVGVFMKTWSPDFLPCTWKEERIDAMRVAAHLDIPFLTFDLEEVYRQGVAESMINSYKAGQTPNPDVLCNREVKFGAFFKRARALGADYVATGHYARVQAKGTATELLAGVDPAKDQSYFLWTLGQEELSRTLFPVGGFTKDAIRAIARHEGLPTAEKKDSQGVCFLGQLDMKDFLSHYIKTESGPVIDTTGAVIGTHRGALLYTLGERHGFTITQKTAQEAPYYIVGKDVGTNTVMVSHEQPIGGTAGSNKVLLAEINWISDLPQEGREYHAQVRYHGEQIPCRIDVTGKESARVVFSQSHLVAPGQSVVLYDDMRCMGGGVVK